MSIRKLLYSVLLIALLLTGCSQPRNNDAASSGTKNNDIVNSTTNDNNTGNITNSTDSGNKTDNTVNSTSKSNDTTSTTGSGQENVNLLLQLESSHFKFFSKAQDRECLKDLSSALEDNYARITNDLHISLDKKVEIYIYSDLSTYHKAINQPNAPSWAVGNAVPGSNSVQMVNPSNADGRPYSDFMKVIVHEFTHVVVMNINPNIKSMPTWLSEGIAVFEAKQDEGVSQTLLKAKSSNKFSTLKDLETDSYTFGNNNGYQFSYSIMDCIVKAYGYDKLIALIKSPAEFEKILGTSRDDFEKEWRNTIK